MRPLVDLQDVVVRVGGVAVLAGVTLRVQAGDALCLEGPNGGGKTTLLRLLAGQVAPLEGTRAYGLGGGVQRSAVQARRTLNVVGPDVEAFYLQRDWAQTAEDLLLAGHEGDVLRRWDPPPEARHRLAEVTALTGIGALLARDFRTLSHGQRRRVLLARALMAGPELLLLDEFTDGLSPAARAELGDVLRRVHASGVAIVLATHRPDEVPALPWRRLRVAQGRVTPPLPGQEQPPASGLFLPPPPGQGDLIRLEQAEVYRNGHRALGPLSWTWKTGQHWLVTGENGSGKSTLARLIAGELHPALGGRVTRPYLARDQLSSRRRTVGLVSAEVGIRQRRGWSGRDILASAFAGTEGFSEALTPGQQARLDTLAHELDLGALLDRPGDTLSQGQLRRLLLARAMLHAPKLLLLDEGLDFLDAGSRARVLARLPDLARAGTHLLVVAHRASDAPPGLTHQLHLDGGHLSFCRPLQTGEAVPSPSATACR
ncbi:ATP-binding cassette domain-containing protein [Deinococcus hohokamensis]|uniref:ATP-binding cassette domain-containing protein n=1 Tax=Deinococcus hohokamensis TaxID=309883 RepID=A0ABV9IBJ5_9DEIO